ncbi:MAG: deoxyribodipyrimidine photo-lyase [Betaproteobacteria bacterium]|nr:deoxyribodipyrimidine photo-lyase [Betaproteobacteria bacterium]
MTKPLQRTLFWFRRDLRDHDNAGLYHALKDSDAVWCVFIFDTEILDALPSRRDRRVEFIHGSVIELDAALRKQGGGLIARHARAREAIPALAAELGVEAVYANHDYEPAAISRDAAVADALKPQGIALKTFKDTVIFEKNEVTTQSGGTFSVFTPYKNAWLKKLDAGGGFFQRAYPVEKHAKSLARPPSGGIPTLANLGFESANIALPEHEAEEASRRVRLRRPEAVPRTFSERALGIMPGMTGAKALVEDFVKRIGDYKAARDYPAVKGVSHLSVHNRFGTVSIRELVTHALHGKGEGAATWLSELVWRDFYFQILWHHPHVVESAFKREYDAIRWPNDNTLFAAWCEARTGYPIVDAAMRQINQTGYMHNRLRMIAASFLTKDLHIDWRWGEKYFADNLNDFDLAANNGGWQWAASSGCDAQPYFRIFNPVTQSERFDPRGEFIRRYLPELAKVPDKYIHAPWTLPPLEQQAAGCVIGKDYPAPVVDHALARKRTLALYAVVKKV